MQSGATLSPGWHFITQEQASSIGSLLAQNLNCSLQVTDDLLECLQTLNPSDIFEGITNDMAWMPIIEPSFLPQRPLDILQSGNFNKEIDVIIGSNVDDGLLTLCGAYTDDSFINDCRNNIDYCGPSSLYYKQ